MTIEHTFSNEIAKRIFGEGVSDEESQSADRTHTYLSMYRKFYSAGRDVTAKKWAPVREANRRRDMASLRSLKTALDFMGAGDYDKARKALNKHIGI